MAARIYSQMLYQLSYDRLTAPSPGFVCMHVCVLQVCDRFVECWAVLWSLLLLMLSSLLLLLFCVYDAMLWVGACLLGMRCCGAVRCVMSRGGMRHGAAHMEMAPAVHIRCQCA